MSELKQRLQAALNLQESDFDYHATDLYVRSTPEVVRWLRENYEFYSNIQPFISQIDNKRWLDIPFAGNWKEING